MKYRREMTAVEHLRVLEDKGEIRIKGMRIIIRPDEDGEVPKVVSDYIAYCVRHGYEVVWG